MTLFNSRPADVIQSCKSIPDKAAINLPHVVNRVTDPLPPPTECPFCAGEVRLVNNARFYGGREFGWPLAYACRCGARVGCHPGTTIPLGTLADKATKDARRCAHEAFDPLWKGKGPGMRRRAYQALQTALGTENAHISWMGVEECTKVVKVSQQGLNLKERHTHV